MAKIDRKYQMTKEVLLKREENSRAHKEIAKEPSAVEFDKRPSFSVNQLFSRIFFTFLEKRSLNFLPSNCSNTMAAERYSFSLTTFRYVGGMSLVYYWITNVSPVIVLLANSFRLNMRLPLLVPARRRLA